LSEKEIIIFFKSFSFELLVLVLFLQAMSSLRSSSWLNNFDFWEMLLASVVKAVQVSVSEIDLFTGTGSNIPIYPFSYSSSLYFRSNEGEPPSQQPQRNVG
jgi:hypothetical protein